jgi:hypothetical protein
LEYLAKTIPVFPYWISSISRIWIIDFMLNLSPGTASPPRSVFPGAFSLHNRKRGGQPGNSNALRHGLYSAQILPLGEAPHTHAPGQKDSSTLLRDLQDRQIISGKKELQDNRFKLARALQIGKEALSNNELLSKVRAVSIIAGKNIKIIRSLHELGGRQGQLRTLVWELPALLRWEFYELGIPARPAFVPRKLVNLHANLDWEAPHFTDAQWWLLQETFVSLHADLDYFRKYRRRKPLPSDRFLLEGILWKLANGLRWRDLAGEYPVRLCQELYFALYRSGRMQTIYNRLLGFLNVCGETTLQSLVERGCFVISGSRVLLAPSETLTWEKYSALLLLQRAYHARRSIKSRIASERRRKGCLYRLPSVKVSGSLGRSPRHPSQPRPHLQPAWPTHETTRAYYSLKPELKIRETESVGKGFLYGKIRRSKIQRKPFP